MVNNGSNNFKNRKVSLDSINISDIDLAKNVIDNLPDIREERVKEVKEKYSDSKYEEDAELIADKILEKLEFKKALKIYEDE